MKKVSIIMGAYNCENTIRACLDSIINQTFSDWEFIICDDCSGDSTYIILEEYANKDSRFLILKNNENMKLAITLNRCLKCATGEYIARMDADDMSLPTRLEMQVDFMDKHPEYAVVGTEQIIFDENGEKGVRGIIERPTKRDMLKGAPFAHPTIMMRKYAYDILGGYVSNRKTMRAEDLELWFRFFYQGFKGYNLQLPLYKYHESDDDYQKRSLKSAIQTFKVYIDGYRKIKVPIYQYIFAIKPIVSAILPKSFMMKYHKKMLGA